MTDLTRDYYERHHAGETGFARYGFTIGNHERIDWFRARVGTGRRVLDIGCRDGTLTGNYVAGNQVTGVDVDAIALAMAAERLAIPTHHVNLNVEPLPFVAGSFDVVIMGEVLEHLQFPELVVKEVTRVLAPRGRYLGSVPNAFRLKNRLRFLAGEDFEDDPTHLHHFSPTTLRHALRGFASVEIGFLGGRFRRLSPALFGGDMMWCASL